jgi:hypothetical protein
MTTIAIFLPFINSSGRTRRPTPSCPIHQGMAVPWATCELSVGANIAKRSKHPQRVLAFTSARCRMQCFGMRWIEAVRTHFERAVARDT